MLHDFIPFGLGFYFSNHHRIVTYSGALIYNGVVKSLLRAARKDEIAHWDELIATNPAGGEVFQAKAFACIKARQRWRAEYWVYETSFGPVYTLMLSKKIPFLGKISYIPRGPGVIDLRQWREVCRLNRKFMKDAISLKMEPPILCGNIKTLPEDLLHVTDIQGSVAHTVIIKLNKSEDDLWRSFRQRARRSIRGSRKEQLHVVDEGFSHENALHMWQLYKYTANRAHLVTRERKYYYRFWRNYIETGQGRFFFVVKPDSDQPIAGAFVQWSGVNALYKDGGSRRDTCAHFSHLLQWQIMRYLRGRGIQNYDLGGTPPSDRLDDPTERLASLATFKLSFGAPVIDHVGAYDQILQPAKYKRWSRLEHAWRGLMRRTPIRDIY